MLTSRVGRLVAVAAMSGLVLGGVGACSSDSGGGSDIKLGALLKASKDAPKFDESVFSCLDDYDAAADFTDAGITTLKDEDAELTDLSDADMKILAGAMGECVSAEDFAKELAEGGGITEDQATCVVDGFGGVAALFTESVKGTGDEPSEAFMDVMTECMGG